MSGPAVDTAPQDVGGLTPLGVMSVEGVDATSCGGTAVLWVLRKGHTPLYAITENSHAVDNNQCVLHCIIMSIVFFSKLSFELAKLCMYLNL